MWLAGGSVKGGMSYELASLELAEGRPAEARVD